MRREGTRSTRPPLSSPCSQAMIRSAIRRTTALRPGAPIPARRLPNRLAKSLLQCLRTGVLQGPQQSRPGGSGDPSEEVSACKKVLELLISDIETLRTDEGGEFDNTGIDVMPGPSAPIVFQRKATRMTTRSTSRPTRCSKQSRYAVAASRIPAISGPGCGCPIASAGIVTESCQRPIARVFRARRQRSDGIEGHVFHAR